MRRPDGSKLQRTPTVYVLVHEWEHGEGSAQPGLGHLCHTLDETCPGPNPCPNPGCSNPMHPSGEPCQHGRCCETGHLAPCSLPENQRRNGEQQVRYRAW